MAAAQDLSVDTDYVVANKDRDGVLLVDVRAAGERKRGAIAGAIHLGDKGGAVELRDVDARIWPVNKLERLLGAAGLARDSEIILYGSKGDTGPSVVFWILEYLGATDVRVYAGGIDDWIQAGQPLSREAVHLPAARFAAVPRPEVLATTDFVVANLGNADVQFVDTRSARESAGEDIRALRGGHIAAVNHLNIPYEQTWIDPDAAAKLAAGRLTDRAGMALKSHAALAQVYGRLDPNKEVVAYCQTGTRSAYVYWVLRQLGYTRVRNYDDSWIVWGSDVSLPAANVSYYDFVKVNAALRRLEALEVRLGELSAKS